MTVEGIDSGSEFLTDCGQFDLYDDWVLEWQGKEFLDEDGNVTRVVEHVWGSDTFRNSETGETLTGTISAGEIVDLEAGTVTESGTIGRITVAGVGVVFFDVGKFIIEFGEGVVFLAGRHHAFFEEDYGALCDALS